MRTIVEQVIVQLAVTAAKLLLLEEEAIVHEGERVEDVKLEVLGQDEGVMDEGVEAGLMGRAVIGLLEAGFGGVIPEVGDAEDVVLGVSDDGGLDAVEREEVGDFPVVVLGNVSVSWFGMGGGVKTYLDHV